MILPLDMELVDFGGVRSLGSEHKFFKRKELYCNNAI